MLKTAQGSVTQGVTVYWKLKINTLLKTSAFVQIFFGLGW